jgi:hypothetical protein
MPITGTGKIALPAVLDLDAIDTVRDELIDVVEQGPVEISAVNVERVSTNALFMLLSAAETARRNSFAFSITDATEPMLAAIDKLALSTGFDGILKRVEA